KLFLATRYVDDTRAELCERGLDELGLTLPHEAGIHVDTAHPRRPQRAQAQGESHGGIHTAAHEEEYVAVADPLPDLFFGKRHPLSGIPVLLAAADAEDEVVEELLSLRGVHDFGVKLDAE